MLKYTSDSTGKKFHKNSIFHAVSKKQTVVISIFTAEEQGGHNMLFVCYPKCSTCKKAQKWLDESGAEYTLRDIKTDNPTAEELKTWWEKSGLPLKRFFNTSGNIYKEMKLKDKLPEMSEEEQLALLATDGMLVKRPILVAEDKILVGAKEKEWEEYLMP